MSLAMPIIQMHNQMTDHKMSAFTSVLPPNAFGSTKYVVIPKNLAKMTKWKSWMIVRCICGWARVFAKEISTDPKSELVEIVFLLVLISWSVASHFTLHFA
jgi:hypothetical protein